jgi:hypothetical protein
MYENYLHFIMRDYSSRMSVKEFTLISQTNTVTTYLQISQIRLSQKYSKTVKCSEEKAAI